ncbi:MAG: ATPase P [Cycloclasticus sp. symbiont of Bathymodiolus heckerae]|nr:MAG: ATPase P [Cycloclasticus sp. symbiont of Bathymodiolus heckerae]
MTIINHQKQDKACFHCGLEVPSEKSWGIDFDGCWRAMCCPGCEAVAKAIIDNGLSSFYQKRTAYSEQTDSIPSELEYYDNVQDESNSPSTEYIETTLIIEGITCSACVWLLERHVRQLTGVLSFSVNYATRRALLKTKKGAIRLSEVLAAIQSVGYRAFPYDSGKQFEVLQGERKDFLSRIGVAVFCGMQVMMITVGIYMAGQDIDADMLSFMKWVSAFLTLPVLLFSGMPFLRSAYRDLENKRPGMDVPVALGIGLGFAASLFNTFNGQGDTYYESVCMFVVFLLSARYVEFLTRWHAVNSSERMSQAIPLMAKKIVENEGVKQVSAKALQVGDVVQINPGEAVPADAVVLEGSSHVDESILTGENHPLHKKVGESLLGGSHNLDNTLIAQVVCVGEDSTLSTISRLIERGHSEKPAWVERADRYASVFVLLVILVTVGTAWGGFWQGNENWFSIALSVLVVTCPCALSLATPTAYTAAMSSLFDKGIIITKGTALEKLATIKQVVFDKTGTLTQGTMSIENCEVFKSSFEQQESVDIAIGLEQFSDHPIARAFKQQKPVVVHQVVAVEQKNGAGLSGEIKGIRYYLGSENYVREYSTLTAVKQSKGTQVYLANEERVLAVFEIHDDIRHGARNIVQWLKGRGKYVSLLSGDKEMPVTWLAKKVGIDDAMFNITPQGKLDEIDRLQVAGKQVVMVGDGINDAPVLAKADVSVSVSGASQLARSSSDILLMSDDMESLQQVFQLSAKMNGVIKQNMLWALVYNIGALPLAMAGYVEPWQAALGMSVSSLVVVLNSFRLRFTLPVTKVRDVTELSRG